jgi:hypothetical protein
VPPWRIGVDVNSFNLDFTLYNFRLGPRCNVLTQRDGSAEETMRARISSIVHIVHVKKDLGKIVGTRATEFTV